MIHNINKNSPVDEASTAALLSVCRAVNIRQNENGDTLDRIQFNRDTYSLSSGATVYAISKKI